MVDFAGNDRVSIHLGTADNRRGRRFPEVSGNVTGGTHDDICLLDIRDAHDQIRIKLAVLYRGEHNIVDRSSEDGRHLLVELAASRCGAVHFKVLSGLAARGRGGSIIPRASLP